ncbi:MAG: biopolymer transporter ExbD [Tannerella sp.]|jgi:biopolymer transport protein ExbD|nr:biopolymer transporter ExbD [Tannerella sp.]
MSKIKTKKQSTFIDMTAMSDVTVLLLTFFMLTSTFLPKEPLQVITPASVIDIKIPEANLMTILIKPDGQVYLNLDRPGDKKAVLELVEQEYNINFTDKQKLSFVNQATIGVPISQLPAFLDMQMSDQDQYLKTTGVPTDSLNNQLKGWIQRAVSVNNELKIAIKADKSTPYPKVSNVIATLQDLKQNRFNLITTLKGMPEGF